MNTTHTSGEKNPLMNYSVRDNPIGYLAIIPNIMTITQNNLQLQFIIPGYYACKSGNCRIAITLTE